jgi:hypothetical protein
MHAFEFKILITFCIFYIIIGLFGNVISILIFTNKRFLLQPTTVYLIASRILALIILLYLPVIIFPTIWTSNDASCKFFGGIMMIITQIQPWLISFYSVDRLISLLYPFKLLFKNKLRFQLVLMLMLIFVIFWIIFPIILFYDKLTTQKNISVCSLPVQSNGILVYLKYEYMLIKVVLPFFFMITSSIMILWKIIKNKQKWGLTNIQHKRDFQFGISLVACDFIFLILKLPNLIKTIKYENDDDDRIVYDFSYSVYTLIGSLYNVLFFLIFILFNKTYRKLFKKYTKLISKKILKILRRRTNRIGVATYNKNINKDQKAVIYVN